MMDNAKTCLGCGKPLTKHECRTDDCPMRGFNLRLLRGRFLYPPYRDCKSWAYVDGCSWENDFPF